MKNHLSFQYTALFTAQTQETAISSPVRSKYLQK